MCGPFAGTFRRAFCRTYICLGTHALVDSSSVHFSLVLVNACIGQCREATLSCRVCCLCPYLRLGRVRPCRAEDASSQTCAGATLQTLGKATEQERGTIATADQANTRFKGYIRFQTSLAYTTSGVASHAATEKSNVSWFPSRNMYQ